MNLTKLEYTTIKIYAAMIASLDGSVYRDKGGCDECDEMITQAIHGAHKLLIQLETQEEHSADV